MLPTFCVLRHAGIWSNTSHYCNININLFFSSFLIWLYMENINFLFTWSLDMEYFTISSTSSYNVHSMYIIRTRWVPYDVRMLVGDETFSQHSLEIIAATHSRLLVNVVWNTWWSVDATSTLTKHVDVIREFVIPGHCCESVRSKWRTADNS